MSPNLSLKVKQTSLKHNSWLLLFVCARLVQLVRSLTARFNPRPGRGLNFGQPSFATPSVDRDVTPLV